MLYHLKSIKKQAQFPLDLSRRSFNKANIISLIFFKYIIATFNKITYGTRYF